MSNNKTQKYLAKIGKEEAALALDFFVEFARFEYALKRIGFHQGEGAAKPDWRKFAESVEPLFTAPQPDSFRVAIDYYLTNPPWKQVVKGEQLTWVPSEPSTDLRADRVLLYLRRTRNNFFHGGKFHGDWFEDPQRSKTLLKYGLEILRACRGVSPEVEKAFRTPDN